ncbi:Protein IVY1 [Lentinula edodes]|uniref:Protein IVY1 n=1 Tax=Lentinula edodes TaxID=5353 RepID=A0A1Q3E3P0_LENED|nr:Protein IVY1 [Lentinula edodes]
MNSCATYRAALVTVSNATAEFADAMERCSTLKGPSYEAGTRLQAGSGLHHLIGNHMHVLAETLDRNFEKPLRQHLETYRTIVTERSLSYERALKEKSEIIRHTEKRNMNGKERNLQSFREALAVLQRQVDELDELKVEHYAEIVEHEEEVWDVVQGKMCLVVRSTLDVYDKFTSKASDPVIEPMLQSVPDPFDSYGPPQSEDQIFSILPPLSIMPSAPSSTTTPLTRTPELENMEGPPSASSNVPSSPSSSSPRSVSPTTPIRRHSLPASTGHSSRKAESKLRSVLSVIDEANSRHSTEEVISSHYVPQVENSNLNDTTLIQPQPQKQTSFSWTSPFSYGRSPLRLVDLSPNSMQIVVQLGKQPFLYRFNVDDNNMQRIGIGCF